MSSRRSTIARKHNQVIDGFIRHLEKGHYKDAADWLVGNTDDLKDIRVHWLNITPSERKRMLDQISKAEKRRGAILEITWSEDNVMHIHRKNYARWSYGLSHSYHDYCYRTNAPIGRTIRMIDGIPCCRYCLCRLDWKKPEKVEGGEHVCPWCNVKVEGYTPAADKCD